MASYQSRGNFFHDIKVIFMIREGNECFFTLKDDYDAIEVDSRDGATANPSKVERVKNEVKHFKNLLNVKI